MKKSILLILSVCFASAGLLAQTNCNVPVITEVSGAGSYCPGEEVTLEVTGTLNDATAWTWYSGSCNGQSIGTGTTLSVTVNQTTTYFVRGTGGCVGATAACSSVLVKRDDVGPEILFCPADTVVVSPPGQCGIIVTFDIPTGVDACSDTVYVERISGLDPGSFFPAGVTEVKYELKDTIGNISVCSFTVTVADEEPPQITCIENIEVNNDTGACGAIVIYEAPVGTDNCPGDTTVLTQGLGSGSFFPVGVTTETYTVTDAAGNKDSCSFTITVKDIEPPIITLNDKKTTLWPANHKPHEIAIADYIESVTDNCGGITIEDVIIYEVGSDEPNNGKGDGNTTDDIVISDDCNTASLLAERSGTGNGRVYVVSIGVMDLHGNIGTAEFTVDVPHDMGKNKTAIRDSIIHVTVGCDLESDSTESVAMSSPARSTDEEGQRTSVYLNPFSESFSLNFTPKANDHIKVELYNLVGMKVSDLHEQNVDANTSYQWMFEKPLSNSQDYLLIIRGSKTRQVVRVIQRR